MIISLVAYPSLFGMNALKTFANLNGRKMLYGAKGFAYDPAVCLTDCSMAIGSRIAHGYFRIMKTDPKLIKANLANQLAVIKMNLEEEKQCIIRNLAKDFNISDEQLEDFNLQVQLYKSCATDFLSNKPWHIGSYRDKEFPEEIMPILKKNNIDPKALNLLVSKESEQDYQATAQSPYFNHFIGDKKYRTKFYLKQDVESIGNITLYPSFFESKLPKATLIHEAGHILEHHGLEATLIIRIFSGFTGASRDTIRANDNYQRLVRQHEREAEMFPALKCKDDAAILRKKRWHHFYPKMLYGEHYLELAFIDTLHKLNAQLTESE